TVRKRHSRTEPKNRGLSKFYAEHGTQWLYFQGTRMAKHIHQQCVGTHAGVQFSPTALRLWQRPCCAGVNLRQAQTPGWLGENCPITHVQEIAVPVAARFVDHDGALSIAANVRKGE